MLNPEFLTVGDVQRMAGGVSAPTVHNADPVLQPMRLSRGQRLYRRDVVEKWIAARAAKAAAQAAKKQAA